jgi:hypothetical protein
VDTPIKVSHSLTVDIWFSVHGEDEYGAPLGEDEQGRARILKIMVPVVVPSVRAR